MGDIERSKPAQFLLGIVEHFRQGRICLPKLFIESNHRHADGRFLEYFAKLLFARFQRRGAIGDGMHFADAAQTGNNEENIFEYDPGCMLDGTQRARSEYAID